MRTPQEDDSGPIAAVPSAGIGFQQQVEALGVELETHFNNLLRHIPTRSPGPQALADTLGITTVTASRFLKAISQKNPIATIQSLPGPNPLRNIVKAARDIGVNADACTDAEHAITAFGKMIRSAAGDRSSFKAMLAAWLPEERKEFEAQRRQSIFKALFELEGVASETEIDAIILHPSKKPGAVDILTIKCALGIDRIRPDAVVHLGTRRLGKDQAEGNTPRLPLTLEGKPALQGLDAVRLDQFCNAPPAPLQAARLSEGNIEYSLAPTGFGPASKVDLVIAELNQAELRGRKPDPENPPCFFVIPEMSTRKLVFDLLVHEDVYKDSTPQLMFYKTTGKGPARAGDPSRRLDLRSTSDDLQMLGNDHRSLRLLEFPAYAELRQHAFQTMRWNPEQFRIYRVEITYPLVDTQVTLAFCD